METMQSEVLRLVLFGKSGSGKSASGNTILGRRHFETKFGFSSVTKKCSAGLTKFRRNSMDRPMFFRDVDLAKKDNGQAVMVIDTPGFGNTHLSEDEVHTEVAKCVALSAPGPHAFLLVVPLGRYTEDDDRAVKQLTQVFGEEAVRHHTLVLFTGGDELKGRAVEDFFQEAPPGLQALIRRCGGRYHVFNNRDTSDSVQVKELIRKVKKMAEATATGFYTSELYERAKAAIREEQERLLRRLQKQMEAARSSSLRWMGSLFQAALPPKAIQVIKTAAAVAGGALVGAACYLAGPVTGALVGATAAAACAAAFLRAQAEAQADARARSRAQAREQSKRVLAADDPEVTKLRRVRSGKKW